MLVDNRIATNNTANTYLAATRLLVNKECCTGGCSFKARDEAVLYEVSSGAASNDGKE